MLSYLYVFKKKDQGKQLPKHQSKVKVLALWDITIPILDKTVKNCSKRIHKPTVPLIQNFIKRNERDLFSALALRINS